MDKCALCGKVMCSHWHYMTNGKTWECRVCGVKGIGIEPPRFAVTLFEGKVVDLDITPEWRCFEVCEECYAKTSKDYNSLFNDASTQLNSHLGKL